MLYLLRSVYRMVVVEGFYENIYTYNMVETSWWRSGACAVTDGENLSVYFQTILGGNIISVVLRKVFNITYILQTSSLPP